MAETYTNDVAENARALVARRQIRQVTIAERLGLNQQQVSRRMTGQVEFSASELQKLAALLGVPVGELLGEVPA